MSQVDVISVPFTFRELADINNSLERYIGFCDNCINAFKGTGHDLAYNDKRKRASEVKNKVITAMTCFVGSETEG